jgi:beta-glucosidase
MTWARRLEDYAATDPRYPERSGKDADHKTVYSEGVHVGYRWFDRERIEPLFPFGYGLSYTTFQYSALHVERAADGGLTVSFRIANTGAKDGEEVPQVYLGAPRENASGAAFAVRSLAAFDRVSLQAGESKTISLHVAKRRLQYWSTLNKRWEAASRNRILSVGASSRDLRLEQSIDMK